MLTRMATRGIITCLNPVMAIDSNAADSWTITAAVSALTPLSHVLGGLKRNRPQRRVAFNPIMMSIPYIVWAIGFSLFLGGVGLPIPENPFLIGGGYAISIGAAPALVSVIVWYVAICIGDFLLYSLAWLFFNHPKPATKIRRWLGAERLDSYQRAFAAHGALTLFLARFAWGVRFLAYVAAGAAHYPWKRFVIVDSVSVLVQVLLFVAIGYVAGDRMDLAQNAGHKLVVISGVITLVCIVLTWVSSVMMKRVPRDQDPVRPLSRRTPVPVPEPVTLETDQGPASRSSYSDDPPLH